MFLAKRGESARNASNREKRPGWRQPFLSSEVPTFGVLRADRGGPYGLFNDATTSRHYAYAGVRIHGPIRTATSGDLSLG